MYIQEKRSKYFCRPTQFWGYKDINLELQTGCYIWDITKV